MQIVQNSGPADIGVPFVNGLHAGYRFLGVRKFLAQNYLVIHWQDGDGPELTVNLVSFGPGGQPSTAHRFLGNWQDEATGEMKHLYQF